MGVTGVISSETGDESVLLWDLCARCSSWAMTSAYSLAISSIFLALSFSITRSSTLVFTVEILICDCLALSLFAHDLMLAILPGLLGLNGLFGPA